jgi:hypothetical protein
MSLESRIDDLLISTELELDDSVTELTGVSESSADRYASLGAKERTIRDLIQGPVGLGMEVPAQYRNDAITDLLSVSVVPNDVDLETQQDLAILRFVTAFRPRWDHEDFDEYPKRGAGTISKVPYRVGRGKGIWKTGDEDVVPGPSRVLDTDLLPVGYISEPVDMNGKPYCLLTTATDPTALAEKTNETHPVTRISEYNITIMSLIFEQNFASPEIYRDELQFTSDPVTSEHHSYPWEILADHNEYCLRMAIPHDRGQNSLLKERVLDSL